MSCRLWLSSVLLTVLACLFSGCAVPPEIPPYFDGIHRQPVKAVRVDGHRIAYLDAGDGPTTILIHGFGGSLWQWEYQHPALAGPRRVITLDLLGSGFSDKPDLAYTPQEMVEFLRGFMDALGVTKASLVGNSMGGGLAVGMALTYPERVDRLVLISGLPDRVREKLTGPLIRRGIETQVPLWVAHLGSWIMGGRITKAVLEEIIFDHSLITPAVLARSQRHRRQPGYLGPIFAVKQNLPLWEEGFAMRLGELRQPTLILWGEQDEVFTLEVGRHLHQTIPGSIFVSIPDAGHIPMWERPDLVNPALRAFLPPPERPEGVQ